MEANNDAPSLYRRIYAVVRQIPKGRVATYGQVARLAGVPRHARQVGYALHALPAASDVPWHRVINAKGRISLRRDLGPEITQQLRLEREGVCFIGGRVPLGDYGWEPVTRSEHPGDRA